MVGNVSWIYQSSDENMIAADADGQAVCWELQLAHQILGFVVTLTHCLTQDLEHYV